MRLVAVSVRALVEHVFSSGSIETRGFGEQKILIEGTKAHQKVQSEQLPQYQKEVHLKLELEAQNLFLQLEGRCDGIIHDDKQVLIDEIKSTARRLEDVTEQDNPVYWAQAMVYGYMYGATHHVEEMTVQLTYYQRSTGTTRCFSKKMSFKELEQFALDVVEQYAAFMRVIKDREEERDRSIQALGFPFETYRQGQRELAAAVYAAILHKKRLFARAPTGIGKTISTLFPAIKAIGEGKAKKIFYLTAKTITRTVAEETFELLKVQGLRMKVVTLTAKEKVCFKDRVECHPDFCEFADGYYDRIHSAVLDALNHEELWTREIIERYARKHRICPFELSLDLTNYADCVICDYNYIFDPRASLKRYGDESKRNTVLLIDEAHNLVERSREMFSADLEQAYFEDALDYFSSYDHELVAFIEQLIQELSKWGKEENSNQKEQSHATEKERLEPMFQDLQSFTSLVEEWLSRNQKTVGYQEILDLYFHCHAFLQVSSLYGEHYTTICGKDHRGVRLTLFCLDPRIRLKELTQPYRATTYFSATLVPLGFYKDMLGGDEEAYTYTVPSPFHPEHLQIVIHPLSTRLRDREKTMGQLVQLIAAHVQDYPGNYLVFSPSYSYMSQIYEEYRAYQAGGGGIESRTQVQQAVMSELEREEYLRAFQPDDQPLIGFAVLGGMFSEGVNLKGDRLKGVIIVGVGLPQISEERESIKQYFEAQQVSGQDYAYIYPGMNKVLQAGGRLIRTETDTGRLILVDDRYLHSKYQALLPVEWRNFRVSRVVPH